MLFGLRLSLLPLCIAGCASQLLLVPDSDWQTVPAPQRATIDQQSDAELIAARAELAAANAGLAAQRGSQQAAALPAPPAASVARPDPDSDAWTTAIHEHDQARVAAFTRIETARAEWLRTDRAWRALRLDTANARVAMVIRKRELTRAQAIDHHLPGQEHYDVAPLRGQFSRAQQHWHAIANRAREARAAFERASATLASAKEAYAQLMRNGPGQLAIEAPAGERARLELTGWAITRSDIVRRRGLRHYLDVAASAPPRLRKATLRLRAPTLPAQPVIAVQPETPATPRSNARTAEPPTRPQARDLVAPLPGEARTISKPAAPPRSNAPALTTTSTKPWDAIEPTGAPSATTKPATAARGAAAPGTAATSPGQATPAKTAGAPGGGPSTVTAKTAGAPGGGPSTVTAKTAGAPGGGPSTVTAKTGERASPTAPAPDASATTKPPAIPARGAGSAPAATGAAKPVQSPLSPPPPGAR